LLCGAPVYRIQTAAVAVARPGGKDGKSGADSVGSGFLAPCAARKKLEGEVLLNRENYDLENT